MKTYIVHSRGHKARVVSKVACALGLFAMIHMAAGTAFAADLFAKPTDPTGTNVWGSVLTALQYVFYALYLLGVLWIVQAWKDFKDGNQKDAWQKIGGALGIFLSPAIITIIRSIGSSAGGTNFGG